MITNVYGKAAVVSSDKHRVHRGPEIEEAIAKHRDNRTSMTRAVTAVVSEKNITSEHDSLAEAIRAARGGAAHFAPGPAPPAPESIVDEEDTELDEGKE